MMNGGGKSDRSIVPGKPANEPGPRGTGEESVEGRDLAKGNTDRADTPRTQSRKGNVPSGLERVRQVARRDKQARFTAEGELGARRRHTRVFDAIDHGWLAKSLEHRIGERSNRPSPPDSASLAR